MWQRYFRREKYCSAAATKFSFFPLGRRKPARHPTEILEAPSTSRQRVQLRDGHGRGTYVKIESLGRVNMVKLNKLSEARSRLYRRQILQVNIRW